jgi:CBS domain-containing protein
MICPFRTFRAPSGRRLIPEAPMSTTVRQMLARKAQVLSVPPDATMLEALTLMAERNVGALLVVDGDRLIGIVTERDYARKVALAGRSSQNTPVSAVMSSQVITITPQWTADQCVVLMDEKHIRHLPVIENDRLIGVISIRDAVKAIIAEQQFTIRELENYITRSS